MAIPEAVIEDGSVFIPALIAALGLAKSNSDARRHMEAGAVSLEAEKLTDPKLKIQVADLIGKTLRVGKHQFRKLVA